MQARGFSLIELVVAITIAGVIAAFIGMFLKTPTDAYFAQVHRADLTDSADAIVRAFEQDIPTALPYSVRRVRSGSNEVLSFLATADSARYLTNSDLGVGGTPARELDFSAADGQFSLDGQFHSVVATFPPGAHLAVMNNSGTAGTDVYNLANVITPNGTSLSFALPSPMPGEDQIKVAPPFQFANPSATNTVFVVTSPVTYICDESAGTVTRYSGYPISPTQYTTAGSFPAGTTSSLVARFATSCQFSYLPATAAQGDVVSIRVLLTEVTQGQGTEQFQLFHQVAESRAP
jgi:MSHA biogenesis protein MshO